MDHSRSWTKGRSSLLGPALQTAHFHGSSELRQLDRPDCHSVSSLISFHVRSCRCDLRQAMHSSGFLHSGKCSYLMIYSIYNHSNKV